MSKRFQTADEKVYDTFTDSGRLCLICEATSLEWAASIAEGLNKLQDANEEDRQRKIAAFQAGPVNENVP